MLMNWKTIDSQEDLESLAESNDWEDSETLEFYATQVNEDYFPTDVCRSGHRLMNIHLLMRACSTQGAFLEMLFIQCDSTCLDFLTEFFFIQKGKVDNLKRVELLNEKSATYLRCARLMFRYLEESEEILSGHYYCFSLGPENKE